MSTTLQPDPYEALGVAKDADIAAIRAAHRKLVLKHHPDRIHDPALKEKGKDAFQKIQQAYELLSDEGKRRRYDDEVKLAALRREAVMRDQAPQSRSQTYPMRPAPPREAAPREYSAEDNAYYETRRPRHEDYGTARGERFEEAQRSSSRKYDSHVRPSSSSKKSADKERSSAKASWTKVANVVNAGVRVKKEAERTRSSKTQEAKDRERRKERTEKEDRTYRSYQRPTVSDDDDDSDSDTATRVTSSTIKPSRPSPRHTPQSSTSRASASSRAREESDDSDYSKWEMYHEKAGNYIGKANAGAGKRPTLDRATSSSFWSTTHHRSGSESDRRPGSSRDREYDSPPSRPHLYAQNSAPSGLKSRVDEPISKDSRRSVPSSPRERDYEPSRREPPSLSRAKTMPVPRSASKKDAAPSKSSKLKQTETHDSGYGSSSGPQTPDPREPSPVPRTGKQSSTRYHIVEPESDEDDRATQIHLIPDEDADRRRRRRYSPERHERRERPEIPRLNTTGGHGRSHGTRDTSSPVDTPKLRRHDSSRYDERSSRDSPRESPSSRGYNSSREKLYEEPGERESRSYRGTSGEKTSVRPSARQEAFASYAEPPRSRDYAPSSRFHSDTRGGGSRRPSVQAL